MSLSKTLYPLLNKYKVQVGSTQEDNDHPNMTEKLLTGISCIKTNKENK